MILEKPGGGQILSPSYNYGEVGSDRHWGTLMYREVLVSHIGVTTLQIQQEALGNEGAGGAVLRDYKDAVGRHR